MLEYSVNPDLTYTILYDGKVIGHMETCSYDYEMRMLWVDGEYVGVCSRLEAIEFFTEYGKSVQE